MDDAVFSCRVDHMKPDMQIYQLACSNLGTTPAQCFFVGDGGFDELRGASAVGMQAIQATWYLDRKQQVESDTLTGDCSLTI